MSTVPPLVHRFFQVAIENVADAIEVTDEQGRFAYVNPAWERLTGYSQEDVLGKTPRILRSNYHPEEYYDTAYEQVSTAGYWSGELVSRRKDGGLIFTLVTVTGVVEPDGAIYRRVGVRTDLTGELSRIREHGDRYAMAMLATRDGLSDWDIAAGEVHASERWREIIGVQGTALDLPYRFQEAIHPEDAARFAFELYRHLGSHERFFEAQFRVIHPGNRIVHVEKRAVTLRDNDGRPARMVAAIADVTDRKASEAQLFHSATHDALTNLPNRALFVEHLKAAIGRSERTAGPAFCLLYIDLRHFKSINDGYGHAVGDALLRSVADRLARCIRPGDRVARLGGDEFAMLLGDVTTEEAADAAARRVLRSLERPHEVEGRSIVCAATIGVALGDREAEVDHLVRAADSAMYEARRDERRGVGLASEETAARSQRRARMLGALREALAEGRLEVHYQPVVALPSQTVTGAEALARWAHPEFGNVSPVEFVPLAEEFQLASRLGQLVLERSLADLAAWTAAGLVDKAFTMHVNVSPHQLLEPRLLTHIARLHAVGRLPPGQVCFEITETALVARPDVVASTIESARNFGVSFALDDFGTGYSSLSHLRRFAVSTVKIDRSFVMQLPGDAVSRQIVSGLLTMTRALGMDVVAEGVETSEHEKWLVDLGCGQAQGYHYAKPAPAAQFEKWLRERTVR